MRRALLALALLPLPLRAAEIPSVPEEAAAAPLSEPTLAPAAAPELSQPAALSEMSQVAIAAPAALPALPATAAIEASIAAPNAAPAPTGARETVEAMVRRLLREPRRAEEPLAAAFDGAKVRAEAFPDSEPVGAARVTRHGDYALVSSEVKHDGKNAILLERWSGPHGGVWLSRKRGPDAYEVKEWHGADKPLAFGGVFLPQAAYAEVWLTNGRISSSVSTAGERGRRGSTFINAKQEFRDALAWFGSKVTGVEGSWSYGSNLEEFNRRMAAWETPEQAALGTWTGQRAAEAGFTRVVFPEGSLDEMSRYPRGHYGRMSVLFLKP